MDLGSLPVIDWEAANKLAGNNREFAETILGILVKGLANDISSIQQSHREQNYSEMLYFVHKLHGALCYCGLPRLKIVTARLETELKSNIIDSLPPLIKQLDAEGNLLLERYSYLNN